MSRHKHLKFDQDDYDDGYDDYDDNYVNVESSKNLKNKSNAIIKSESSDYLKILDIRNTNTRSNKKIDENLKVYSKPQILVPLVSKKLLPTLPKFSFLDQKINKVLIKTPQLPNNISDKTIKNNNLNVFIKEKDSHKDLQNLGLHDIVNQKYNFFKSPILKHSHKNLPTPFDHYSLQNLKSSANKCENLVYTINPKLNFLLQHNILHYNYKDPSVNIITNINAPKDSISYDLPITQITNKFIEVELNSNKVKKPVANDKIIMQDDLVIKEIIDTSPLLEYKMDAKNSLDLQEILAQRHKMGEEVINVITLGHVDAGKSTLIGHMLYLSGNVSKKAMHKNENESKKMGKGSFAYAWVLDETGEERSRGITMDVTHRTLKLKDKTINLIDSPGHKDFIPNMITGASQADAAILVIDATKGEFETGFLSGGQTREHAILSRSLGILQLIVVINKMDNVAWDKDRFDYIRAQLTPFLKSIGFSKEKIWYVPVSGLLGQNIESISTTSIPSSTSLEFVQSSGTLFNCLDKLLIPERKFEIPLRFIINDFYKSPIGTGICLIGILETGFLNLNKSSKTEKYVILPANETITIKNFKNDSISSDEIASEWAIAGDHLSLTVLGGTDLLGKLLNSGQVMCPYNFPTAITTCIEAKILVFDFTPAPQTSEFSHHAYSYSPYQGTGKGDPSAYITNICQPITLGFQAVYHYESFSEPCVITKLIGIIDKLTGNLINSSSTSAKSPTNDRENLNSQDKKLRMKKPRVINRGESAICEITFSKPLCIETYSSPFGCKELGRFTLRQFGRSVCAGIVIKIK